MAETVRIEIPIETIDNTDPELSNVTRNFKRMEEAAENANGAAKKANSTVTQFDRQAQKTEKSLARWAKEKYEIMLEAKDKITPILSVLGNGIRSFAGKTWSVTMKAVDLITSPVRGIINLLKNPVFQVGAVLGVSIGLKDTIDTYKDFEAAMSQVQAISGATGSEVTKLTDKAKEMGATTKFTAKESAEAFNYMAMAGWKTGDMLNGIEGILSLAAASGEELATTSDIVTDALTALNMKASDAGRFSDVLAAAASNANTTVSGMGETFKYAGSMAGSLGYSIEDVALMTGLMANTGIKSTMAGTALNSIFTRLSTNMHGAADELSGLGIEFFTSEGNARDLSDVMGELRHATAGMTAEQKSQIANTIAGTNAQKGLLAILNASETDYNKLADAINNADGAAARMSETMLDNLQGSLTLLQSAVDGVKISFGERLSPYIQGIAEWLMEQMPAIEQGLQEFMDWFDRIAGRMKQKFEDMTGSYEWQDADFFGKIHIAWDEFIAEPFAEWWNSTGKARFAGFAQDIGSGIGTGLRFGIMGLLGMDMGESVDAGASIGASFAKGFSKGFDFDAISEKLWEGFKKMLSSAGKLLPGGETPGISSILSALVLGKIAMPVIGLGRGIIGAGRSLLGTNPETGTSVMGALVGSTGNGMVRGSGILGQFANVGYGLSGGSNAAGVYFGDMSGTMSGGAAALRGAGVVGGVVAAAATLVSGAKDSYRSMTSDNEEERNTYAASAGMKFGGVAAGAAIGTVIMPGVGTAIGAGIGGLVGFFAGDKVKEGYEEELAAAEEAAANAKKVMDVTGMSIDAVKFKNEALNKAMNDSSVSTQEFALMLEEACGEVTREKFGKIHLSLKEIRDIASSIVFDRQAESMDKFSRAVQESTGAAASLGEQVRVLDKMNWKAGLGIELDADEVEKYKNATENMLSQTRDYLESRHYEAVMSVQLLVGENGAKDMEESLGKMYGNLQNQIDTLNGELITKMHMALRDGVIDSEEGKEIEEIQNQIMEVTNSTAGAQENAEFEAMKIKFKGAALDPESFAGVQEELKNSAVVMMENYDAALKNGLVNLEMIKGDISTSQYKEWHDQLEQAYNEQVSALQIRVSSVQLESIAEAFSEELDGILPELEGTASEKFQRVMKNVLALRPDAASWTDGEISEWFGLTKLDTEDQIAIANLLRQTAETIPTGAFSEAGAGCGKSLTDEMIASIVDETPTVRSATEKMVADACAGPFVIKSKIHLQPEIIAVVDGPASSYLAGMAQEEKEVSASTYLAEKGSSGGLDSFVSSRISFLADRNATGGYISGGPTLSWLAEEGYGEFVIPTNPSRRSRALELYEQAGTALGVSFHAAGGYVGGSILSDTAAGYNLFSNADRNTPIVHNKITEDNYNGEPTYKPAPPERESNSGNTAIQVSVSISPEFVIQGIGGQNEEDIMQVIRKHVKEMADELSGEIAGKLETVFSNMPLKEA